MSNAQLSPGVGWLSSSLSPFSQISWLDQLAVALDKLRGDATRPGPVQGWEPVLRESRPGWLWALEGQLWMGVWFQRVGGGWRACDYATAYPGP